MESQADPAILGAAALRAWDLGRAQVTPLRLKNNWVFAVRSERGRFALRIHRTGYRTEAHTRSELLYLEALAKALAGAGGFVPVPVPVRTRRGALVTDVPGDGLGRRCDLLTWLDGQSKRPGSGLGPAACRALGELVGRLHAFSGSFVPPPGFELPRWDAGGLLTARSPYRPGPLGEVFRDAASRALVREVERHTRAAFEDLTAAGGVGGLRVIHGDFILGNVVWHGREPALLDFDDCGWGHFTYDLAPLVGNLMDYPAYPRLREALLEGYRRVLPLPPKHEALLETLVAARHAASCLWAAGNLRNGGGMSADETQRHLSYRLGEIRRLVSR